MRFMQLHCLSNWHLLLMLPALLLTSGCGGPSTPTPDNSGAQLATIAEVNSTGTEFFLTLPDHLCSSSPSLCRNATVNNRLIIAATTDTNGEITFNGITTPFTVSAGSSITVTLDPAVVITTNETIEHKAIHVTALAPVSVHVVSENSTSADGYLALPVPGLGKEYRVMSHASNRYSGSEFAIAATQDNTVVTITPSASGATQSAGTAYTITLNTGDTYQLQNPAAGDLTGSLITSDKPVAVFSGHRCADIPAGTGYCDYLVEQLPPVSAWGQTFRTQPFSGRSRYKVRILAATDNTTITTTPAGLVTATLNAGQYADLMLSGVTEFEASKPVLLAQFITGFADDTSYRGDPGMVLVTPNELGMTSATFGVYGLSGTSGALMNIVTETAGVPTLLLDGTAVNPAAFTPVGNGTYSAATLPLSPGVHALSGTSTFSALVYDYGIGWNAVSYAYPVASKLSFPAAAAPAPGTGCKPDDDDHHHSHHHRHHKHKHKHKPGKYCLIKHAPHEYEDCDE